MALAPDMDRSAELARLLGADQLARPARPLSDGTDGRRDPSPSWDEWYSWPLSIRRLLLPYMAPAGNGWGRAPGITPDELVTITGAGSIDAALMAWRRACLMARRGADGWDGPDVDEWAATDARAESDAMLYGPAEYAALLCISVPALWKRKQRGQLPAPDLVLSRVPIWTGETVRIFAEWGDND